MPDTVSKERRSEIMSHIKSKDTSIELMVRQKLHSLGYRYRVHCKELPGKPDIAFSKRKIAIFIHGCFWHGHDVGCRYSHTSQSRQEYWNNKISKTKQRDINHRNSLSDNGWNVVIIWECEIKADFNGTIRKLIAFLGEPKSNISIDKSL